MKHTSDKMNVAIIGGGKISEQHLVALRAIEGVQVTGICDLSPALARFTAERFGINEWFTDYQQMLKQVKADVIHVLTPPATHNSIIHDCLVSKRHVIVEKPVALSQASFRELWNEANNLGLRLVENHNYRFNEPIARLQQAVQEGRIGTVEEIEIRIALNIRGGGRYADENQPHPSHRLPAGVIHEFISHLSYLLLLFMPKGSNDRFDLVRSLWRNHGGGELFRYDDLEALVLSNDVHGRIRFSSRQWPDSFTVTLRGSDGMATAELFYPLFLITQRRAISPHLTPLVNSLIMARSLVGAGFGGIWQKIRNRGPYEGLARFLTLTYQALASGQEPPVTFEQMDETMHLIDSLLAEENRL